MSSILEALKELENERARGAKKATSVADVPSAPPRSYGTLMMVVGGGLVLGAAALGAYLWNAGAEPRQPIETASMEQPARSAPAEAPAPARGPDWLGRAEPPRARVAPVAPAPVSPPPAEPAVAAAAAEPAAAPPPRVRPVAPAPAPRQASVPAAAPPPPAPAKRADVPARPAGPRDVQMESLAFSSHVHQRTVTLVVDGRRATLHQGESLGGVEVQLILADGAYLRRGGDVIFVGKPR